MPGWPRPPPAPSRKGRGAGAELHVDLAAIAANWRTLRGLHRDEVAGVVKADAYG